jgi:hypothetical protein
MKYSQKIKFNDGVFAKKNILNDGDFTKINLNDEVFTTNKP